MINYTETYNKLKEHLIEHGPIPMSYVIGEYLCNITILICVVLVIYAIVYVIYFLFELLYIFLLSEIIGFIIIGNLLPHLFENYTYQYICSAIVGLVVFYFARKYTNWKKKREKEKEENVKTLNKEQKEKMNIMTEDNINKSNEQLSNTDQSTNKE